MDKKNVPRRMKRFYREGKQPPGGDYPQERYNPSYNEESDFGNIPTMSYEDLEKNISDENKKEIQRLEHGDLEQKLALFEVEKFKKKNKRLPNKKESQQMADNLYTQFKDNEDLSMEETPREGRRGRRKGKERMPPSKRKRMNRDQAMQDQAAQDAAIAPKGNIKDLFGSASASGAASKNIADEFKLDLGGDEKSDDLDELGDLESGDDFSLESMDEAQTCPSCNEKTDKIIYCSKCGAAFCKKCGKDKCPKCGVAVKN
ncbi:MAG: hypothetical protein HN878_04075 [Candidatus Diapherotrites archaeon]|nr:hypothetical protein [Candidatus Diapherotrites archaeon]